MMFSREYFKLMKCETIKILGDVTDSPGNEAIYFWIMTTVGFIDSWVCTGIHEPI